MADETTLKPVPVFRTDEEAERFADEADPSEYDFSGFKPVRFELERDRNPLDHALPQVATPP